MCNSVEDVIKVIQTFMALEDIESIAEEDGELLVIDGSCLGIQQHPDNNIPELMEKFDLSAYCYLLTPEGLINHSAKAKLAKHNMEIVKLPEDYEPIKYAIKVKELHFLFNS